MDEQQGQQMNHRVPVALVDRLKRHLLTLPLHRRPTISAAWIAAMETWLEQEQEREPLRLEEEAREREARIAYRNRPPELRTVIGRERAERAAKLAEATHA